MGAAESTLPTGWCEMRGLHLRRDHHPAGQRRWVGCKTFLPSKEGLFQDKCFPRQKNIRKLRDFGQGAPLSVRKGEGATWSRTFHPAHMFSDSKTRMPPLPDKISPETGTQWVLTRIQHPASAPRLGSHSRRGPPPPPANLRDKRKKRGLRGKPPR